ncbi:hypothetical protein ACFZAM_18485 [Streptomyces sp. NPDC008079]|uniref:hypothetical protein n=1 Tax=Streptomyces sp. NPDC008079 TaxID=3364806 RepID=UPI0036E00E5C
MYILWQALTERPDRTDPEGGVAGFIAVHELAGVFPAGSWEPVRASEARSGVRLWSGRPAKAASGEAASSGEAADPGALPWHDVLAEVTSWGTRGRRGNRPT